MPKLYYTKASHMIGTLFQPFRSYKFLLAQLTLREIRARYKQSILGYVWVIFNPFIQLLVYTFVFSLIIRFPTNDIPYPLFLAAALLPWNLFQTTILASAQSLVENASLLRKVAFPREVIPYSVVIAKLVDFFAAFSVFLVFYLIFGQRLSLHILWLVPILGIQIIFTSALALILSALNLFYRDIQYLANLVVMMLMYLSPVVYSVDLVPDKYRWLYQLNPLVGIFQGVRAAIFSLDFNVPLLLYSACFSITLFFLAFALFKKLERQFADTV